MRIVAFDIGITHLAYVVLDVGPGHSLEALQASNIVAMQLLDIRSDLIAEPLLFNEARKCHTCSASAQHVRGDAYSCGRHRGKDKYEPLQPVSASHLSVEQLQRRLFMYLWRLLDTLWPLDILLLENQPTRCHVGGRRKQVGTLMKSVGTMVQSFFLMHELNERGTLLPPYFQTHYVHPAAKWFLPATVPRPPSAATMPSVYADRKNVSGDWMKVVMTAWPAWSAWLPQVEGMTRPHDVADALLLAMAWYLKVRSNASVRHEE